MMKPVAGRMIGAGIVLLAMVLFGSLGSAYFTQHRLVIATVRLNEAGWGLLMDERHDRVLAFDAIDSPLAGANSQPELRMLNTSTGRVARTLLLRQGLFAPVLDESTGHMIALATLGRANPLSAVTISTLTGTILRATSLPTPPTLPSNWAARDYSLVGAGPLGSVTVDEASGYVLIATRRMYEVNNRFYPDNGVFILNLLTGMLLRTVRLPGMPVGVTLDLRTHRAFVTDGVSGALWFVDPATGTAQPTPLTHGVYGTTDDATVQRAIALDAAGLHILDTRNGRLLRTMPGSFGLPLPVVAQSGRVLVTTPGVVPSLHPPAQETLRLIDIRQGRMLWTTRLPGTPQALAVDKRRDRSVVATCTITRYACVITVISTNDGRIQREINVPALIDSMVVDEKTGHVFIETQGNPPIPPGDAWSTILGRIPFALPFLPHNAAPPSSPTDTLHGTITVLDLG